MVRELVAPPIRCRKFVVTDLQRIKEYWDQRAAAHGTSDSAVNNDPFAKQLELRAIEEAVVPTLPLLELGCGNGQNLFHLAKYFAAPLVGVDYSENMIASAKRMHVENPTKANLSFHVGDILSDLSHLGKFDQILTVRCIINLPTAEQQLAAVSNLGSLLNDGGRLFLVENFSQPLNNLNGVRARFGLEPIKTHWHNRYLDEPHLIDGVQSDFEIEKIVNFSSTYYLLSRVVNALLTPAGQKPDYFSRLNEIARDLPGLGDYGPNKMFILKRKH